MTEADVFVFGLISGDWSPIHSMMSLRSKQNSRRELYGHANHKPVSIGDTVEVRGEVVKKENNGITLEIGY